jgi:hypothetical protein
MNVSTSFLSTPHMLRELRFICVANSAGLIVCAPRIACAKLFLADTRLT